MMAEAAAGTCTCEAHVERRYERPILSSLHAMHSLGALAAAGVVAVVAAAALSVIVPFAFAGALLAPVGLEALTE